VTFPEGVVASLFDVVRSAPEGSVPNHEWPASLSRIPEIVRSILVFDCHE